MIEAGNQLLLGSPKMQIGGGKYLLLKSLLMGSIVFHFKEVALASKKVEKAKSFWIVLVLVVC